MGLYLNPGNSGFAEIVRSEYVDKSGLIRLINDTIGTTRKLACVSRPRRFGKSFAAKMLCAYYGKGCDSRSLFSGLSIENEDSFDRYLNKYDVIYLDMTNLLGKVSRPEELVPYIGQSVTEEVLAQYPEVKKCNYFDETLWQMVEHTGGKVIMIIDEWDAPIRETPQINEAYLKFLRMLFKSSSTTAKIFAAVYMTGILPIKKDGSQSAISDFKEYSMLEPMEFAEYFGFTEDEVRRLCDRHQLSFESAKHWYDGYSSGTISSIYNPYSIMSAMHARRFQSYWKRTSAAEGLMAYIDIDMDGLQEEIVRLIAGDSIEVDTGSFENDLTTFATKDDVLTLMVHLGFLTYIEESTANSGVFEEGNVGVVRIPNEEVREEFKKILRRSKHRELVELVRRSDQLLKDTLEGNTAEVAEAFQRVHDMEYAPTLYNNEQSLRYVVKMAYISCIDQYAKIEELPSGHGIADVVFLPKKRSPLPAMIIELKWDKSADVALDQIKDRQYENVIKQIGCELLLVGINYNSKTKEHACVIKRASVKR